MIADRKAAPSQDASAGGAALASAMLNILEDAAAERAGLADLQTAFLNILEDAAGDRARSVDAQRAMLNLLEDFDAKNAEIERANRALAAEVSVRKQAEETLSSTNKELESFSYSIAHDLRAPLRSVDGFSQALVEDYGDKLEAEARDYLGRIRGATQHMALMIDELLKLARVSRGEIEYQPVDLSAMAKGILAELREAAPERRVECVVAEGIVAHGDPRALRVVLENLLSNAWKFTGKKEQARIEFGRAMRDGRPAYFVRDDGAGFDMAYVSKLFGAFQRLHSVAEFPGIGIGLAIVQRVILRHGGRVWAEGATGKGATFSFTLPEGQEGSNGQAINPAGGRQP